MAEKSDRHFETRPIRRVEAARKEGDLSGTVRVWCPKCQRNEDVREREMTCLRCGESVRTQEQRLELDGERW